MTMPFIAMGFGLVVIASVFLTIIFYRAWCYPLVETDSRYNVVIVAMMVGTVGVGMWAFNPLMQALNKSSIDGSLMFLASLLLFGAMSALIGSTALGGTRLMLYLFLGTAVAWVAGVLTWWYLL